MKTALFNYPLPARLIAQHPVETPGTDRMLVLNRKTCVLEHRHIADIGDLKHRVAADRTVVLFMAAQDIIRLIIQRFLACSSGRSASGRK